MTLFPAQPRRFRGRTAAAWSSAALATLLLAGCTSAPAEQGGRPASTESMATAAATASPEASSTSSAAPSTAAAQEPQATPAESREDAPAPPPAASSEALTALNGLKFAARGTMSDYDRDKLFGGWIDADGNCADTRQEILNRDLTDVVSADGCKVDSGVLAPDPYTGKTINFVRGPATSSDVQIDHVVSLGNAWITGARNLSQDQRVQLSNDPLNLLAVDGPANQSKSDMAADAWLPPNADFRCEFVAIQIAVKAKYELWVTAPEKTAMTEVLADCEGQALPIDGTVAVGDIAGNTPAPAPKPVAPEPAPVAPAPAPEPAPAAPATSFANCTEAKAAGAAPLYSGSPGYAPKLDRDGDGIACEK